MENPPLFASATERYELIAPLLDFDDPRFMELVAEAMERSGLPRGTINDWVTRFEFLGLEGLDPSMDGAGAARALGELAAALFNLPGLVFREDDDSPPRPDGTGLMRGDP